eukprot:205457-Alexandrium_andersonii.AAC.1
MVIGLSLRSFRVGLGSPSTEGNDGLSAAAARFWFRKWRTHAYLNYMRSHLCRVQGFSCSTRAHVPERALG